MSTLRLVEHRTTEDCTLSREAVGALLDATVIVRANPGHRADRWDLTAGSLVGATRIAGTGVVVEPKLPIRRVLALLGYATSLAIRTEDGTFDDADGIVDVTALLFARSAERALAAGLLQGYRHEETVSTVVRGRVDLTALLARRHAIAMPVDIRYDEFDVDIAENQILRATCRRPLATPDIRPATRRRLSTLLVRFADVRDLPLGTTPAWAPTRLNERYVPALRLAALALGSRSIELGHGTVTAPGLLVDLATVFEDFLEATLGSRLTERAGRCVPQRTWYLDDAATTTIRPDLVWLDGPEQARAVIDAKYKGGAIRNPDLCQLVTYRTRLGLDDGHIVSVGRRAPTVRTIIGADVRLHEHALDLDVEPRDLLTQVDELTARIARI